MVDLLRTVFLESLILLLMVLAVAMAVALALHRRRMTPGTQRGVWLTALVCVLLLAVQYLVQTDRERIHTAVAQMARAIDDGDIPTLGSHLDRDFVDRSMDKSAWLADVRQRLQRWRIDEAKVSGFTTEVEGDSATVSFRARCNWRSGEQAPQMVMSTWKLAMVRREDGWKLHRVVSARFGPGGAMDYAGILQY
jgi:hypothetical protein